MYFFLVYKYQNRPMKLFCTRSITCCNQTAYLLSKTASLFKTTCAVKFLKQLILFIITIYNKKKWHMWNRICLPFRSTSYHPHVFGGVRVAKSIVFYVASSVLIFVCFSFYFKPWFYQFISNLWVCLSLLFL